jgi:HEAT repeat protein
MATSRASKKIQGLKDKGNIEGLIKLLKRGRSVELRMGAAEALGEIGDEHAVDALLEALRDKHLWVRNRAFGALGRIGDKRAVGPLIEILQDKDKVMRWGAISALRHIGDERAVEPLIETLKDESADARRDAALALAVLGDKQAVEPLIEALPNTRKGAAEALGWLGDPRAVEPLMEALESWEPYYGGWEEAAVALGRIGDERGTKAVRAYLKGPKDELRLAAADCLLKVGELEPGGNVKGYFIVEPPDGDGFCDDNECPCSGMEPIQRGEGYLYISRRVVNNRESARTESALKNLTNREIRNTAGFLGMTVTQQGVNFPILCCLRAAERRDLDLEIAAKDAAFWWETGLVPLRATPRAV